MAAVFAGVSDGCAHVHLLKLLLLVVLDSEVNIKLVTQRKVVIVFDFLYHAFELVCI